MRDQFEIAGGTVAGRNHVLAGRNNQDACHWHQDERCTIAVVCDGCSEGPRSEIGAVLGAQFLVRAIERVFCKHATNPGGETRREPIDIPRFWPEVRRTFLEELGPLIPRLASITVKCDRIILDHFLFTVVGVLLTERYAYIFSVGDGVVAVNGEMEVLGPFPGNAPPYPMYAVMDPSAAMEERTAFCLRPPVPIGEVQSLLLGTDGVTDLIAAEQRRIPGKDEIVGPLAQFWTDDQFFRNPDMVRRRLTVINRESVRVEHGALVRESGLLPDDTTLVVIRRRKDEAS